MTTLVIIIEQEALISAWAHEELLQPLLSLFFHVKTTIGCIKQIRKKMVRWNWSLCRTTRDTLCHLLDAQESTCWLRLLELKRAERCVDFSTFVASIKPEMYVNLLIKRQKWTFDLKESKRCDACNMNGQRKPTTRDWRPSLRRARVDLLVDTSKLKTGDKWMEIVFYLWPDIRHK